MPRAAMPSRAFEHRLLKDNAALTENTESHVAAIAAPEKGFPPGARGRSGSVMIGVYSDGAGRDFILMMNAAEARPGGAFAISKIHARSRLGDWDRIRSCSREITDRE
jgi:hypothetical protein